jgi:hypothetical protein
MKSPTKTQNFSMTLSEHVEGALISRQMEGIGMLLSICAVGHLVAARFNIYRGSYKKYKYRVYKIHKSIEGA